MLVPNPAKLLYLHLHLTLTFELRINMWPQPPNSHPRWTWRNYQTDGDNPVRSRPEFPLQNPTKHKCFVAKPTQSYSRKVCIAYSGHCFIGGQTKSSTRMEGPSRRLRALHSRQVLVLLFLKSLPVADFFLLPPVVWSPGLFVYYYAANVATRRDYGGK